jgi:sulfite reductase beta subunit-like hemoprotein
MSTIDAKIHDSLAERHSPEAINDEIRLFEERISQLRSGQITDEQFRPFRLKHGIYGQRQPGVQMVRVKVPSGVLTADQLRTLAQIADAYSTGRGHLTTRENIQFHFVKLENVPAIMRLLADAGLTTREACGNTVRNVTSCPLAGICPGESFDVTPYALGITRFLLRHPEFHDLPRKFKIAFSGCEDDGNCAVAGIHDVGLIARVQPRDGVTRRGFKVMLGGGLGSLPTEAATLTEFLPDDELLPTIDAVLRVFTEHGNRKNKYKARLKFVLRDKGIDELRRLIDEKRKSSEAQAEVLTVASPVATPLVSIAPLAAPATFSVEFTRWRDFNVMPQRQQRHFAVWIKIAAGGVTSGQLRGLAKVLDERRLPGIRIAVLQDFVIPWVQQQQLPDLFADLRALDLAMPGARTIADVTGCPGATTCNLGITRSLTLAEQLSSLLADQTDPEILKLRIKISGCPNSCGHHHIADIGLYGNARKIGDQQAPFYQLLLGGAVDGAGVRFGKQTMVVAAKQVPQTIRVLLDLYRSERRENESFRDWLARTPEEVLVHRLRPHAEPPEGAEENFVDWGDIEQYSLQLGRGECA